MPRALLTYLLAVLLACLPAGCGPSRPDIGEHLVIGVGRDFYDGPDSRDYLHGSTNTWEALTYLDANLRPVPWLARSWRSLDGGRRWVFELRRGVRFHDGSPFTARDAAFCLKRLSLSPKYDPTGCFRELMEVRALGSHRLACTLSRPNPAFPCLVAYYGCPMVKPEFVDAAGRITRLVATGPYRLSEVLPGREVRLEAFEGYWGPRPAYQRVTFRMLLDAQTRLMALLAGDIDAVADVGAILPEQEPDLASVAGVRLKRVEVATTHYLVINCRRPPFHRAAARRWLAGLVARAGLVGAVAGGIAIPAADPYSRLARDWAFGLPAPPLAEGPAPAPRPEPLVILLHGGTIQRWPYLDLAQTLQQILQQALQQAPRHAPGGRGPAVRIQVVEAGAYYQALRQGDYDLSLQPNTLMTGDPDFFYSYYLAAQAPANPGWSHAPAQELIRRARLEMDRPARRAAYRELALILGREIPLLPLFHEKALYAHRRWVADFSMDHFFRPDLIRARPGDHT